MAAGPEADHGEDAQPSRRARAPRRAAEIKARLRELAGCRVVLLLEGKLGPQHQGAGPDARRDFLVKLQETIEPADSLGHVAVGDPRAAQRRAEPQALLGIAALGAGGERRTVIGSLHRAPVVHGYPLRPRRVAARERLLDDLLGLPQHVAAVPQAQGRALAGSGEAVGGVLLDGVEQPVARVPVYFRVERDQRLVDQGGQQVEHLPGRHRPVGADLLGHLQIPAGEHGEPAQQDLLGLGQQFVAPVHGGPQGLLTCRGSTITRGKQLEPAAETARDLLDGQGADPCCGQLDGQRHAVQGPAQPHYRARIIRVELEPGAHGRSPVGKQPDRLVAC